MQSEVTAAANTAVAGQANFPVPAIPDSEPPRGMHLKLKRGQRASMMGKVIFTLDARMDVPAADAELIRKYKLGDDVIYESASRQQSKEATNAHLQAGQSGGTGKALYRLARAGISATAAALSLKITVNSLMSGHHIECKNMSELIGAETAIIEASTNLRTYIEMAETFDGREELIEF